MNEQNEVRATGGMPGLEWIVNSIKSLRFKVVKLSTYNSLQNQLKLKDQIIIDGTNLYNSYGKTINEQKDDIEEKRLMINSLDKDITNRDVLIKESSSIIELLETQIKTLEEMNELLQTKNTNQSNTIFQIHNERAELIKSFENLKNKYQRKYQPRIGGKFAKKK